MNSRTIFFDIFRATRESHGDTNRYFSNNDPFFLIYIFFENLSVEKIF